MVAFELVLFTCLIISMRGKFMVVELAYLTAWTAGAAVGYCEGLFGDVAHGERVHPVSGGAVFIRGLETRTAQV